APEETTDTPKEDSAIVGSPSSQSGFAVTIVGVLGGIALIALFGGILWASGVIAGKRSEQTVAKDNGKPERSPTPDTDNEDIVSTPTPEPEPSETASANPTPTRDSQLGPQAGNAQILAAKISPKNYRFDPEFVVLIGGYVNDYKSGAGYYARARKYRDAIDKAFVNVQGLPPVFVYWTVMSRTKFLETNGDVWGLPNSIVKGETFGSSDTDPSNPSA